MSQKIFVASDHAGFELKTHLLKTFQGEQNFELEDLGPNTADRVDYPDFADFVAKRVNESGGWGLLVCGSAQGMAMRANKYPKVRAAICWSEESARLSRQHNNANILCLGERLMDFDLCTRMFKLFYTTEFEGGRHTQRVEKIRGELK